MTPEEKVLYTDGRDVTVTYSSLKVKNTSYTVSGITKYGLMILKPHRWPGLLLFVLGVIMAICGFLNLIPNTFMESKYVNGNYVGVNTLALWLGAALALIGILITGLVKERYAVRISTAEGEKDAVVSDKKEYITQIVDALNQAMSYVKSKTSSTYFTTRPAK